MKNKNILYISIALVIYVLFISFPTYLFVDDIETRYIVEIILRSVYLVFIVLFSIFTKLAKSYNGKTKWINMLILLPLFFVAFFNMFYLRVVAGSTTESLWSNISKVFYSEGVNTYEILRFVSIVLTVVEEEILFRFLLQKSLNLGHKFVRIAITAAVFTACHFFTMLYDAAGNIEPLQLLVLIFIFGIGMILGVLYEFTNNIYYSMVFNMIFSLQASIFPIMLVTTHGYPVYLTASLFAVGSAAYICLFYFVILKKEQR